MRGFFHFLTDSVCADIFPRAKQLPLDPEAEVPHLQELQNPCDSPPVGQFSHVYWPSQCEVTRDRIEHIGTLPCHTQNLVRGQRGSTSYMKNLLLVLLKS